MTGHKGSLSARPAGGKERNRILSISERISQLNNANNLPPKPATARERLPGRIADKEGPVDAPRDKPFHRRSGSASTTEQKRFASLLENRLINIIAEKDAESSKEKERAKKSGPPSKKITLAMEIAMSKAWASGSSKPVKNELPACTQNPLTRLPSPQSPTPANR
jgi:hypothetical protein